MGVINGPMTDYERTSLRSEQGHKTVSKILISSSLASLAVLMVYNPPKPKNLQSTEVALVNEVNGFGALKGYLAKYRLELLCLARHHWSPEGWCDSRRQPPH
jgi:hypothetical protein